MSVQKTIRCWLGICMVCVSALGCAELVIEPEELCGEAVQRLEQCGAITLGTTFDGCSTEVAEHILNSNCGEMAQTMMAVIPPKSSSERLQTAAPQRWRLCAEWVS